MIGAMAARKVPNMIRRRQVVGSIPAVGLIAWPRERAKADGRFIIDDGTVDLRPQFLVNAVLGEPNMRVKVHFDSLSLQRPVWLAKNGYVRVNGVDLKPGKNEDADLYIGHVPVDPLLRIEIVRSTLGAIKLQVLLPTFQLAELPKTYRYPEALKLAMSQLARSSEYKSVKDSFTLDISHGGSTVIAFLESVPSEGTTLIMKPWRGNRISGPNASALLFRLQRVALSELTDVFNAGWIVVTIETRFPIDLL